MKKSLLYLLLPILICACAQKKQMIVFGDEENQISFEDVAKNLGDINQGEVVRFEYKFTNTGKNDVRILNAVPTCGCVSVKFPTEFISPNNSAAIKVAYDTDSKSGLDKKSIVVQTNLARPNDIIELYLEAKVITK